MFKYASLACCCDDGGDDDSAEDLSGAWCYLQVPSLFVVISLTSIALILCFQTMFKSKFACYGGTKQGRCLDICNPHGML